MRQLGLATIGLPCSSFVFMNAATAKRSNDNPFGDESLPHVQMGNLQLGRIMLVATLSISI